MASKSLAAAYFAASVAASVFVASPASAGSDYTADEIVRFFAGTAELGASRGICVGTLAECEQNAPKPAGLDMMINFELDSASLTEQAQQNLAEFAKALKDDRLSAASFVVEGYTDASGAETYNQGLSERRAQSVTSFLLENGISREKVEAIGMGEQKPRVEDAMDPVNRRVEMRVKLQ